jgi:hypothetical protein
MVSEVAPGAVADATSYRHVLGAATEEAPGTVPLTAYTWPLLALSAGPHAATAVAPWANPEARLDPCNRAPYTWVQANEGPPLQAKSRPGSGL